MTSRIARLNAALRCKLGERARLEQRLAEAQMLLRNRSETVSLLADDPDAQTRDPSLLACVEAQAAEASEVLEQEREQLDEMNREVSQVVADARSARNEFLARNYRLALHFAGRVHRQAGGSVDLDDLVMEAMCGMIESLDRFDPERGAKFSTYAAYGIRAEAREFSYEQRGPIRVPLHQHRAMRSIRRYSAAYRSEHGIDPTKEEVAAFLGVPVARLSEISRAMEMDRTMSLDATVSTEPDSGTLGELLADPQAGSPEDSVVRDAAAEILRSAIQRVLRPREQLILTRRFGLAEDGRRWTLEEIGRLQGVTRERIRQIEVNALRKLRADVEVSALAA